MADDAHVILVCDELSEAALGRLRAVGAVRLLERHDEAGLAREIGAAHALVVRTYTKVTSTLLEAASRLKVIGRGGVGLENIDVAAARGRGIEVVYTPAAASDTVAEFTLGLMLALERHILAGDAMARDGRFMEGRRVLVGRELGGRTLGIVGMGRVGRRVGRMAAMGLGMKVRYNDIVPIDGLDFPAQAVEKDRIWCESDVISLHVPLTDLTRGLVEAEVLSAFQPSATLINTARGLLIDAVELARALDEGRLAGAALDVHHPEPLGANHPLLSAPNVLLTPHIAARTDVGLARMNDVVDDVIAVLQGQVPQYPAPEEEAG